MKEGPIPRYGEGQKAGRKCIALIKLNYYFSIDFNKIKC